VSECCIVVPIHRWPLDRIETDALRRIQRHVGTFDLVLLAPEGLQVAWNGARVIELPHAHFASRDSYSRLLLSEPFYRALEAWTWCLIAQPDAIVLGSDLGVWLDADLHYVGAPWLRTRGVPSSGFGRVGNGGFSLRRVDRFLAVLRGETQTASLLDLLRGDAAPDLVSLPLLERLFRSLELARAAKRGIGSYTREYTLNEDRFWSDRATVFDRHFKVASVEEGLRFSFEEAPRLAYEMNGRRLPFGAHAWQLYDRDFWYEMVPDLPQPEAS
jgi:hypothetical protein